jgi:uncharacterized repeat protein (TIGR01451 family)
MWFRAPSFVISKRANVQTVNAVGNTITWTIQVTNTGNVDLTSFSVVDPLIDGSTNNLVCAPAARGATLTVAGGTTTCTGTYVVTQNDLNSLSSIVNNVTASFTQASPQTASATVSIVPAAALTITKTANPTVANAAGTVIRYTIKVSNVGNVDLPNMVVSDPRVSSLSCAPVPSGATLSVAQPTTTCTGFYIVTQDDMDSGLPIINVAQAQSSRSAPVSAQAVVNVQGAALFTVTKLADRDTVTAAGQRIRYSISIVNTGTIDLTNLQVTDNLIPSAQLTCAPVAIGQTLTVAAPNTVCSGAYTVTQKDIDAGVNIVNIATVQTAQVGPLSAQATTVVTQQPSFIVTKVADTGVVSLANASIGYTITITNTGNVALPNLLISDPLVPNLACAPVPQGTTLPVASSTTCTGSYRVTQADLNSGNNIVNTASVTSTNFGPVVATATTRVQQNPTLSITKTGDSTQANRAGTVVTYAIRVVNTGNIDLTNFQLSDPLIDTTSNDVVCFPVAKGATLTVAQPVTQCTGTYTVTQANLNSGIDVVNVATASAVQAQPVSASFTTRIVQNPSLAVTKAADRPGVSEAGEIVLYTVVVRNTGNVDLTNLQITDALIDSSSNNLICTPVPRGGVLTVNTTTTCSGSYTVSQLAINAGGSVVNQVSAASSQTAAVIATVSTPILQLPAIQVVKTADRLTVNSAGQVVRFTISVMNVGNMDLNNLQVVDPLIDSGTRDLVCSPVSFGQTLPVDSFTTCTGSYIVKQSDLNAGGVLQNVVSVVTAQTQAQTAQSNTIVAQTARLLISKVPSRSTVTLPGQAVVYSITVTNAGNVDLTNLNVIDTQVDSPLTCQPVPQGGTLTVAAPVTVCTGSKVITQSLINQGKPIVNTATASSLQAGPVAAMATVYVVQESLLTLTKTASVPSVNAVGQTITFTMVASNQGSTDLTNFQLSDPFLNNQFSCTPIALGGTLAIGRTTTCTGSYTITQTDLNLGRPIVNIATAQTAQAGPVTAMVQVPVVQQPSFTVSKTASPSVVSSAGQAVIFSVVIRNTGNIDLNNFQVSDPLIDFGNNDLVCSPVAEGTTLTVANPVTTCVGSYTVQQSDINSGLTITNVASVNSNQFGPVSARTSVSVAQTTQLTVSKTASVTSVNRVGQAITWSIRIVNTGNTDITNLQVLDPLIQNGVDDLQCFPTAAGSTLKASIPATTCSGTYIVTQQDLNNGPSLVNTVTVSGTGVGPVTATASVGVVQQPSFTVVKTGDRTVVTQAGQVILYNIIVRNTGNVDLPGMQISDPKASVSVTCWPVTLGSTLTVAMGFVNCTTSYTVSQADLNNGAPIVNVATVSFTGGSFAVAPQSANFTTQVTQSPSLKVSKSADRFSVNAAGQVITFSIIVQNTGNVDLPNVAITDALVPNLNCPGFTGAVLTVASPIVECTGTYTVTQANVDAGRNIVNTVSVTSALTSAQTATATVFLTQTALLGITKTASVSTVSQPGQQIVYSIVVVNAGNVAQTGLVVTDSRLPSLTCNPAGSTLNAGSIVTCTGTYTVTQQDLNAGGVITNTATARTNQAGPVSATATVTVFSYVQFTATKTANVSSVSSVGQVIGYSVLVQNTGSVTLTALQVSDPLVASISCSPVALGQNLAQGTSTTCVGTKVVSQADINNGAAIVNTATVSFSNAGPVLTSATVGVNSQQSFSVFKVASPSTVTGGVGQVVNYNVTVVNTGTTDLTGFIINDPMFPGGMSCAPVAPGGTLPRGGTTTCLAMYSVTQADVTRGSITNVVTVIFGGLQRSASFVVTVQPPQPGSLQLVKTASPLFVSNVGDVITYNIVATNKGTSVLTAVTITDSLLPLLTCAPTPNGSALAPGAALQCTGTLTVTQNLLLQRFITNTATATAANLAVPVTASATVTVGQSTASTTTTTGAFTTLPPSTTTGTGSPTSTAPPTTTPTPPSGPFLFLSKTASPPIVSAINQQIGYAIVATNANLFSLANVNVVDPVVPNLQCSPPSGSTLAPGARMICSGFVTVTAAQIAAGVPINNTAVAAASQLLSPVTASASVGVAKSGSLGVIKTSSPATFAVAGQLITFSITVLNNLNQDAQFLQIQDPLIDLGANNLVCFPVGRGQTLARGQSTTCTGTYTVTANDTATQAPIVNVVTVNSISAPQATTTSATVTYSTAGQLNFQVIIIGLQGAAARTARKALSGDEVRQHAVRAVNLTGVGVIIRASNGAVYFESLDANGAFTGIFPPGPATIFVNTSTLPFGVTLVSGSNPLNVTIPANGVASGLLVFAVTTGLGGHVYFDVNGNGVQDVGEPNIANAAVTVATGSGSTQVVTNATGDWFSPVSAGLSTSTINVASLGLGNNIVQTQGTNPTQSQVTQGSIVFQTPAGFFVPSTTTTVPPTTTTVPPTTTTTAPPTTAPPTTAPPTTAPPTTEPSQPGVTEINFYFAGILNGAAGFCCNKTK